MFLSNASIKSVLSITIATLLLHLTAYPFSRLRLATVTASHANKDPASYQFYYDQAVLARLSGELRRAKAKLRWYGASHETGIGVNSLMEHRPKIPDRVSSRY